MSIEKGISQEVREAPRERVAIVCDTKEDAVEIVRQFWNDMPHGRDITKPDDGDIDGWVAELTMGDRTRISKGFTAVTRGKWIVSISGNHQILYREANEWITKRGL